MQAAILAEVLALGKMVDGIQTQQQLRLADTCRDSSSAPLWPSWVPQLQQAQEEVKVKCVYHDGLSQYMQQS